jgi:serine/threonine-protein kinase
VYVTDRRHNRVLKLPVGSTVQTELPFTGLDYPWGLAVDSLGTVYVAGNNDHIFALRQK